MLKFAAIASRKKGYFCLFENVVFNQLLCFSEKKKKRPEMNAAPKS